MGKAVFIGLGALAALCGGTPAPAAEFSQPHAFSRKHAIGSTFQSVRLLGALRLTAQRDGGLSANEFSGLAWDADEARLYAISDNGVLAHLAPAFDHGALVAAGLLGMHALRGADGRPMGKDERDAEGLALRNAANGIRGDTELLVAFEEPPRLLRFAPDGRLLGGIELPPVLAGADAYSDPDAQLQAVAEHPEFGVLLAPQRPLADAPAGQAELVSIDGRRWSLPQLDARHSALLGLEVAGNGDVLLVERVFESIFKPVVFAIRRLPLAQLRAGAPLAPVPVARFSTREDWQLDNFESIAHHQGRRYFLISDDNDNRLQKTLLLYLEIMD